MKKIIYLLSFIFLITNVLGQDNKYPQCTYVYFKDSKKISSSHCYDKEKRWGQARAFNKEGKVIFEQQLRTIGGHASVYFSYHPNGAVSKAEWSSAPDGGIQWYKSTDEFSTNGELTNHWELNNDSRTTVLTPTHTKPTPYVTPKPTKIEEKEKQPEVSQCGEIFVSEFWLINRSKKKLTIFVESKSDKGEKYTLQVAPKDTIKGGQIILAEQYDDPTQYFTISITVGKKKRKQVFKIDWMKEGTITVRKGLRKYFFEVR